MESEQVDGYHDCECCKITVIGVRKCPSCATGECDPALTWHCTEVDACDGTVCEMHTPKRDKHPVYVKWEAPDGAPGSLRLDAAPDAFGWWVSRRFPGTTHVEWIGYFSPTYGDGYAGARFASQYGEGLDVARSLGTHHKSMSSAVRSFATDVVKTRDRHGVYGHKATVMPGPGRF